MKFAIIPVTAFEQNCTLLWCEKSNRAAVIDPGGDIDTILDTIKSEGVELEKILITHAHIDHAGGACELAERAGVPIEGPHKDDQFWIDALPQQSAMFNFPVQAERFAPDRWFNQDDQISVGEETLAVLHCPGHTPGHVVFFHAGERVAIVGDVLFKGSVGRTDFPQGDHTALMTSIKQRLLPLGDDVTFIPGHGPTSTLGHERKTNPFIA